MDKPLQLKTETLHMATTPAKRRADSITDHSTCLSEVSTPVRPKYPDDKGTPCGNDKTKDSGIGTTQFTDGSSGSTSSTTSPEQEQELAKKLAAALPKGTSTPCVRSAKKMRMRALSRQSLDSSQTLISTPTQQTLPKPALDATLKTDFGSLATFNKSVVLSTTCTPSDRLEAIDETRVAEVPSTVRRRQRQMHPCEFCDKQFDRPSLLKRHTLTHTGERPFECRYCSKGFSTRSGVNTHERIHTGQRPYVCRVCGRRFAAGSNLIFHRYTHTNTRRHVCTHCPKAFVTPGDLRKHEYTHSGEWPFRCRVCNRGFATDRNLKAHEMTHTGLRPYTCSTCRKSYAQESSLKTHLRTHLRANNPSSPKDTMGSYSIDTNNSVPTTSMTASGTVCTTSWRTPSEGPISTQSPLRAILPIRPPSNLPLPLPALLFSHSQTPQLQPLTPSQFQYSSNQQGIANFMPESGQPSGTSLINPFSWADQYRAYYFLYLQELTKGEPARTSAFEKVPLRLPSSSQSIIPPPQPPSSSAVPWDLCSSSTVQTSHPKDGQQHLLTQSTEEAEQQSTVLDYSFKTLNHQR